MGTVPRSVVPKTSQHPVPFPARTTRSPPELPPASWEICGSTPSSTGTSRWYVPIPEPPTASGGIPRESRPGDSSCRATPPKCFPSCGGAPLHTRFSPGVGPSHSVVPVLWVAWGWCGPSEPEHRGSLCLMGLSPCRKGTGRRTSSACEDTLGAGMPRWDAPCCQPCHVMGRLLAARPPLCSLVPTSHVPSPSAGSPSLAGGHLSSLLPSLKPSSCFWLCCGAPVRGGAAPWHPLGALPTLRQLSAKLGLSWLHRGAAAVGSWGSSCRAILGQGGFWGCFIPAP